MSRLLQDFSNSIFRFDQDSLIMRKEPFMKGSILWPSLVILSSLIIVMTSLVCSPTASSPNMTDDIQQTMTPGVQNMMVSPNQSRIRARVLKIEQSAQFSDKWNLEIEILMIQSIQGGTFAEVEQTVQAFVISDQLSFKKNNIISAEAEYLGDPSGGLFQLTHVQVEQ